MCVQVIMLMAARARSLFQVAQQLKVRCARSPAHALLSPGLTDGSSLRPPTRRTELIEQAHQWLRWAEKERTQRSALQAEAAVQPPCAPHLAAP